MDPTMPRKFFDRHVRPNYEEWLRHPLDERCAKNAVQDANNMAARVLRYWQDLDRSQVYGCGAEDETRYREELVERECPDFAWVRDVAEAHKHGVLTRSLPKRVVTRHDQTAATGFGKGPYGKGPYGGQLVVKRHDGTSRPLADIMRNVIAMWERLLDRMML
jgi:hypothetical protein